VDYRTGGGRHGRLWSALVDMICGWLIVLP